MKIIDVDQFAFDSRGETHKAFDRYWKSSRADIEELVNMIAVCPKK